ncbi:ABC transporter substrate-binding protein [Streptomyces sp. NPDC055078]
MSLTRLRLSLATVLLAFVAGCGAAETTTQGDGVFRFAYTAFPSTLDPHKASTAWDELFLFPTYDRIVTVRPNGEFAPQIAKSWSREGDTMVFTIRDGARFHDGAPVDAAAVKANLDRAMTMPGSTAKPLLSMVGDVTVRGDKVVVGFTGGEDDLLGAFAHRAGALISPKAFDKPDLARAPVGSGPYKVTAFRRDDAVVYAAFDGYHDSSAQRLKGIELSLLTDDDTRLNGVQSGQYDATLIRPEQVETATAADLTTHEFLTGLVYQLNINTARSEFDDVRVRRALNLAVDRDAISTDLLAGSCRPTVQPAPKGHRAHEPALDGRTARNTAEAKRLLGQAGLPNGFTFEALVWNNTAFIQLAEVIQSQLKEVGIRMKLRPMSADQSLDLYQNKGQADALLSQSGAAATNPKLVTQQDYLAGGINNPGKLTDPRIEQLAKKAPQGDRAAQQKDYRQIVTHAADKAYNVTVCNRKLYYATTGDVRDFDQLLKGYDDVRVVGKG